MEVENAFVSLCEELKHFQSSYIHLSESNMVSRAVGNEFGTAKPFIIFTTMVSFYFCNSFSSLFFSKYSHDFKEINSQSGYSFPMQY